MKKKLSLCVIAGNVERYIGRFLDSFGPLADEIVVVVAAGRVTSDRTGAIANQRGARIGYYDNSAGNDWPHVDDFAAARNMAFSMASHDLIMWADTDDVIDQASIAAIREAIELLPDDFDGIEFAYDVPEDGLSVYRPRIIRKGAATWVSPIHEDLKFHREPKLARVTNARILHMPNGHRQPNNERNLRILESIPEAERTTSHRFHLFQSLRAVGMLDDAINEITDLLANPPDDIGQPEKYELFIAAGQLSDDPNMRSQMMLQALGVDPSRREAYGELALCMIGANRGEDALGLTTAMRAIQRSENEVWNERSKYYGYLGEQLHGMALRSVDLWQEADAIETNHFIRNGAKISLIHATRGRVKQAVEARRKWFSKAKNPDAIEHIFAIDVDDPQAVFLTVHNHVILSGKGGSVEAWNTAAMKSNGAVLVQMSDDWEPPLHWDELILNAIGDTAKPAVLAISDGFRTDPLLCMAIMTRARYKDQGFMFHPDFTGMYSDNWFTDCAYQDGVVIEARDIVFEHLHPVFKKAEWDETYKRGNCSTAYEKGESAYIRLKAGRSAHDIPGWCDYADFYRGLARLIPHDGYFVEIGSWMGKSISVFCHELQDRAKSVNICCVDTFKGELNQPAHVATVESHGGSIRAAFEENTKRTGVFDMLQIIEGDSAESADQFAYESLDAIFIDAAHDYDSVVKDLAAWYPKLRPDGIFCGHDYPHWEVKKAVDEHAAANGYSIEMVGRVWIKRNTQP